MFVVSVNVKNYKFKCSFSDKRQQSFKICWNNKQMRSIVWS